MSKKNIFGFATYTAVAAVGLSLLSAGCGGDGGSTSPNTSLTGANSVIFQYDLGELPVAEARYSFSDSSGNVVHVAYVNGEGKDLKLGEANRKFNAVIPKVPNTAQEAHVAYYDQAGRLRLELEGAGLTPLRKPEAVDRLSRLMGFPLRALEEERRDRLVLVQSEPLMAVAGVAAQQKGGQTVSGDTGAWFKHDDGSLYVLLCDGMGAGAPAQRERSLAVRLLEQFLRAGVRPENALRTLSSALALRNDETAGGFTTVDLLRVDLFTGEGAVYKYGAAPTYVRKGPAVNRITGASLPAGLVSGEGAAPDVTSLRLEAGDWVVLVTDGVAGGEGDQWVRDILAAFAGDSPRELAQAVLDGSRARAGAADDRTVLALRLARRTP